MGVKNYHWRLCFVVLLLWGIFFRFYHLDYKIYWHDETYTSLRISGYTKAEVTEQVYNNKIISLETLQRYQHPSSEKTLKDAMNAFASNAEHPPLYYLMARFWVEQVGSSVTVIRSLSALLSLLALPAMYGLCLELFKSSFVGEVAVALMAVSPLFIRYAQEARQYSLWTLIILGSTLTLLRAIRLKNQVSWTIYGVTVALGLYCHLLSSILIVSHGVYVILTNGWRLQKTVLNYLVATVLGCLAFLPWGVVIWMNLKDVLGEIAWMKYSTEIGFLVQHWLLNLSHVFVSLGEQDIDFVFWLSIPVMTLGLLSIDHLCRRTSKSVWGLILTLIFVPIFMISLPDLISGGQRSRIDRYFLPTYLGLQLTVAYLIADQNLTSFSQIKQKAWQFLTIGLLTIGMISCWINAEAKTWWGLSEFDIEVTQIINKTPNSIVISDAYIGQIMPLTYQLNSDTKFLLVRPHDFPQLDHQKNPVQKMFGDSKFSIFLFNPSAELYNYFNKQNITLEKVYEFRVNYFSITLFRVKYESLFLN
jgi:uncharacterized membrane protein